MTGTCRLGVSIINTTGDTAKGSNVGGPLDGSETSCVARRLITENVSGSVVVSGDGNNVSGCSPVTIGHRATIELFTRWVYFAVVRAVDNGLRGGSCRGGRSIHSR